MVRVAAGAFEQEFQLMALGGFERAVSFAIGGFESFREFDHGV
jgi:hypothetical protein